jgi:hypothetical protein
VTGYGLTDPDIIADMLSDGAVDGPNGALLGRYINGIATPQLPVYPGAPVNKLSVAGPMVGLGAGAAAKSGVVLSQQTDAPVVAVRVSQHAANDLFAALAQGAVDADTLVPQAPVEEPALDQAMSVQVGPSAPPGADLGRLLWEDGDWRWLDGQSEGLL